MSGIGQYGSDSTLSSRHKRPRAPVQAAFFVAAAVFRGIFTTFAAIMYRFSTYKEQYRSNLLLALPIVLTQVGQILTQVADNLMVGRYGGDDPTPLAAVSFGGTVFFILFIAAIGMALGLTPLVGELFAQKDRSRSAACCRTASSSTRRSALPWLPSNTPSFL